MAIQFPRLAWRCAKNLDRLCFGEEGPGDNQPRLPDRKGKGLCDATAGLRNKNTGPYLGGLLGLKATSRRCLCERSCGVESAPAGGGGGVFWLVAGKSRKRMGRQMVDYIERHVGGVVCNSLSLIHGASHGGLHSTARAGYV